MSPILKTNALLIIMIVTAHIIKLKWGSTSLNKPKVYTSLHNLPTCRVCIVLTTPAASASTCKYHIINIQYMYTYVVLEDTL